MQFEDVIRRLEELANPEATAGMARFGITPKKTYGVRIPDLRRLAKEIGRDHDLAQRLWNAGSRETMILASMIDDPALLTEEQMEAWVRDFDYWEICDQVCQNLFAPSELALKKIHEWSEREEEFVKRAAFAMIAWRAFKDKSASDEFFEQFFPLIERGAQDDRPNVKKAVSWALRQIGKRNLHPNARAIEVAEGIRETGTKSAKWIASDVLGELTSDAVQKRLREKRRR